MYRIKVENPSYVCRGIAEVRLDGELLPSNEISLVADKRVHQVLVVLGERKNV
jgi:hypothetical protein